MQPYQGAHSWENSMRAPMTTHLSTALPFSHAHSEAIILKDIQQYLIQSINAQEGVNTNTAAVQTKPVEIWKTEGYSLNAIYKTNSQLGAREEELKCVKL